MLNLLRILLSVGLLLGASAQAQTTITLAYENVDSFPWNMKDGSGVDLILLEMVDNQLDEVTFKYIQAPWKRCLNNIKTGKSEGCFTASYKEKRLEFGHYPGTHSGGQVDDNLRLHSSSYSVYTLKGAGISVSDKMTITGLTGKIASPAGYSIGQDLQTAGYNVDTAASKTLNNFSKLIAGRIQAVAALTLNGNNILATQKKFSDKIEVVNPPLVNKPYYLMFSKQFIKQNQSLAEKIWATIAKVRESQEFKDKAGAFLAK